jgi:hypothetical protein
VPGGRALRKGHPRSAFEAHEAGVRRIPAASAGPSPWPRPRASGPRSRGG